jgi:hypothetical protein
MRTAFGSWTFGALAALLLSTGCEVQDCETEDGQDATCAKSLIEYLPPTLPAPETQAWSAGKNVTVLGLYGDINVVAGDADQVTVQFKPFNYRAHDAETEARAELDNNLTTSVSTDANGNVIVEVGRTEGSSNGLGARIDVFLPSNFDGLLHVENEAAGSINPGDVNIQFVGSAHTVELDNDAGVGDCNISGAASVIVTRVACQDTTTVTGVSDSVAIKTTSLMADIVLRLAAISPTAPRSNITTEDGNIDITFPASAAFTVNASAPGGVVDEGTLPSTCTASVNADLSETVTCNGGGPIFDVTAGSEVGEENVTLSYQ